ncbi:hypothetical protein, partial [Paracraurococcus ruber]
PGQTPPRRPGLALPALVFLAALALQLAGYERVLNPYDEGIILVGAERVLQGEVPYRDFWTMYGPGQFYLLAALQQVFGISDLALRGIGFSAKALVAALSHAIAARFLPRPAALATAAAILLLLLGLRQDGFPVFPPLALALASLLAFEAGARRGLRYCVLAGTCIGLGTLFRHDLGAYNAAALGLAALLLAWLRRREMPWAANRALLLRHWAALAGGIALVVLPAMALLLQAVPLPDLAWNLITVPATIYPAMRALPFPGPANLRAAAHHGALGLSDYAVYAPFLAVPAALAVEALRRRADRRAGRPMAALVAEGWVLIPALALICLFFTLKGLVRVSPVHMAPALVPAMILLPVAFARMPWARPGPRVLLAPLFGLVALLLAPPVELGGQLVAQGLGHLATGPHSLLRLCRDPVLPRLRCVTSDPASLQAAAYVRAHSAPTDRIYVGTGRHDRIFVNNMSFYWMAERRSATRWQELHPGIQTTAAVQDAMIREFEAAPPALVVLSEQWDAAAEPNASSRSSGVTRLDDYLAARFEEVARFGPVRVLKPVAAQRDHRGA